MATPDKEGMSDKILGWLQGIGSAIIPGEGGEKTDLFKEEVLPPSWIKSETASEVFEQTGGEFKADEGFINVMTDKFEVIEFDKDMTEVTDISGKNLLEARGTTGSGGIIRSFLDKYQSSKEGGATEIELVGSTVDGQQYNFRLGAFPDDAGEERFYMWADGDKIELEMDQFVTIANNLDEKMESVEKTRGSQDRWSPESFRYAWEQIPKVTVGQPRATATPTLLERLKNV